MEGYGRWWCLLELLRKEDAYRYDISTKFAWDVLAHQMHSTADEVKLFVQECIDVYELLQTDGQYIWSKGLNERMQNLDNKRKNLSERGKRGVAKRESKRQAQKTVSQPHAQDEVSLSQNNILLKPNYAEQNITHHNKTEQSRGEENNATQQVSSSSSATFLHKGKEDIPDSLVQLQQQALGDEVHFVAPYIASGVRDVETLSAWLTAFNKYLSFSGSVDKTESDYRRHFASWFKYRDPQAEDPAAYKPIPAHHPRDKGRADNPTVPPYKSIQQLEQEQGNDLRQRMLKRQQNATAA